MSRVNTILELTRDLIFIMEIENIEERNIQLTNWKLNISKKLYPEEVELFNILLN